VWGLSSDEQMNVFEQVYYPLSYEIFNVLGEAKVFNNLHLHGNYHELPLKECDKVKMTF